MSSKSNPGERDAGWLEEQVNRLDEENSQLKRLLHTNPDTGLPIRRMCERHLDTLLQDQGGRGSIAVAMVRLDNSYERIKETRDSSKALLVMTILRIRKLTGNVVFQSDRLDEFICVLSSDTTHEQFQAVLKKVMEAVSRPHEPPADDVSFGCRVGVACAGNDASSQQLLWQAALTLNEAVQTDQRMLYYSQELGEKNREKSELETDLRGQLKSGFINFYVLYQPIVDRLGNIIAAEILVRWRHPHRGLIPPAVFIPMAEDNGLIRHIGQWAMYQSLRGLTDIRQFGFKGYFSLNISSLQFQQADFIDRIEKILSSFSLPGNCLQLELTEGALMDNKEEVMQKVTALRSLAVRFAIDDFGTGYSSLRNLQDFPINTIKIDRSFVQRAPEHRSRQEIIRTILFMAHGLGVSVQASGVESEDEAAFLLENECDSLQGYYYSPPVDLNRFSQLITSGRKLPV